MKIHFGRFPRDHNKKRILRIRVDDFDVWGLDHTLSMIIHPCLIRLKEKKHGAPNVDDEDVPEELKSTSTQPKENEYDTDSNHFLRWDYVLDEMIFAFGEHLKDEYGEIAKQFTTGSRDIDFEKMKECKESTLAKLVVKESPDYFFDREGYEKHHERMDNGRRLFSKYYSDLWD